MQAVILSIGDELVLGQTIDTNSAYLSAQLARRGIGTLYHQTVPDDLESTRRAIEEAAARAEVVLVSGGLGPTDDDLTRQALAAAMGAGLVLDEPSLKAIAGYFAERGRPMAQRNTVQAMHPVGSRMLPNSCGTAPGIFAPLGGAAIYIVPGVPREMIAMFEQSIVPDLERLAAQASKPRRAAILTTKINTLGWGESTVAERLAELMDRQRNPTVGTTVADGIVSVRIRSEFADEGQGHAELDATAAEVERRLGPIVFGRDDTTLQEALVGLLVARRLTLATAESCTGGLVSAMITDVPGSSAAYRGGWVTYTNAMKSRELGVDPALIEREGAVSRAVACAMAGGALAGSGADLAVAITGIAGPGGGSSDKPVGTVWIALADARANQDPRAMRFHFPSHPPTRITRDLIRDRSARCALQMLRLHLLGVSLENIHWGKEA